MIETMSSLILAMKEGNTPLVVTFNQGRDGVSYTLSKSGEEVDGKLVNSLMAAGELTPRNDFHFKGISQAYDLKPHSWPA
mgnify:CR=1 FL=1